jgi:hypothetical protein
MNWEIEAIMDTRRPWLAIACRGGHLERGLLRKITKLTNFGGKR